MLDGLGGRGRRMGPEGPEGGGEGRAGPVSMGFVCHSMGREGLPIPGNARRPRG